MSRSSQQRQDVAIPDAELEMEMPPRVLSVCDPRAAQNRCMYSLKEKCFNTTEEIRPLIMHLCLHGSLVRCVEESATAGTPNDSGTRNQFCFVDRPAQTSNSVVCGTGASTRPPPSRDYNMSVTQAGIIKRYLAVSRDPGDTDIEGNDVLYSEEMKRTVKLMERMVNLNQDQEAYQDFRFYIDDADTFRSTGSLLPLWRFSNDKAKKKQVTCLRWNPQYRDLFAVSYGSYEFLKQASGGAVIIYSLKNPKFPDQIVMTDSTACSLDWNPKRPALAAVGLYDGTVGLIDIRTRSRTLLFRTDRDPNKHSDPVWEVKWVSDSSFVSVSADGRICTWSLEKSKLDCETLSELKSESSQDGADPISGNLNGLCIDFSPHEEGTYLVGTEGGQVYKFSRLVSSTPLEIYQNSSMAVYSVKWNPFESTLFLASCADWTVKLWCTNRPEAPLCSFDLLQAIGDVDWSPIASTIFAAVSADGNLSVFDLAVNRFRPIASQSIVSKGKLTRVQFNPVEPVILVGDDRGATHCLKLSPNLTKRAKTEDAIEKLIETCSD